MANDLEIFINYLNNQAMQKVQSFAIMCDAMNSYGSMLSRRRQEEREKKYEYEIQRREIEMRNNEIALGKMVTVLLQVHF